MMHLEIVRRIRGNVHGTIDVTALEDRVLSHPVLQRLRRIRQLAFLSYVFPGASHSRFEHSLGVMQQAGITWLKMRANQNRLAQTCRSFDKFDQRERQVKGGLVHGLLTPTFDIVEELFSSPYTQQALRLAALMHDVGHPPFSHSGERFMPTWEQVARGNSQAPAYLCEYFQSKLKELRNRGVDPSQTRVRHEIYTLLLIDTTLRQVYEGPYQGIRIEPQDVVSIITPEITPVANSPLLAHKVHNLCHELISGEVDIDRMDYLLRDSRECGVVYGIFDVSRVQDSLAVYFDPNDEAFHLGITISGLAAFEDYLRARHSMYLQLYFHKTSVAAEAMMQYLSRQLGGFTLPSTPADYAALDETNIGTTLRQAASSQLVEPEELDQFNETLDGLLLHRRLWKRVYEISAPTEAGTALAIEQASQVLRELNVPFERVSSATSLTRFRPRGDQKLSDNYLRLIKKDELQFPRVVPIEDHSQLIHSNRSVHIDRIYVPDGIEKFDPRDSLSCSESIQRRVLKALQDEHSPAH